MKRKVSLILIFMCSIISAYSQTSYMADISNFNKNEATTTNVSRVYFKFLAVSQLDYIKNVSTETAGTHFLGDTIARKVYLLKQRYTYKEPISPGSFATKTIFRKQEIYNSVNKIEKYLKKSIKGGEVSKDAAREEYNKVLDVALNVLDEDTDKFEHRLSSVNGDAARLLKIYINEVQLKE
ncbi:hypothetical protein [uncultured Bacteroides sp.]|uniref:hypothetical protein n=1 Tax=uncultured Bacteroides sp. TaxID=162156 RepID=UPI002AA747D2|nr:hypothetical protein [uncultured Bacteroides sp.]